MALWCPVTVPGGAKDWENITAFAPVALAARTTETEEGCVVVCSVLLEVSVACVAVCLRLSMQHFQLFQRF